MLRHVILWKLKDDYTPGEKEQIKKTAKEQLEGLIDKVPSLMSISVHINGLPTSNCDMMLDSLFEDEEGLALYAANPEHVHVGTTYLVPFVAGRTCLDFTDDEFCYETISSDLI
ncbi:MAG: Dabb family protein [Clostridia bacterium]|nr:Dabb family protein [Clostridia bacterium]